MIHNIVHAHTKQEEKLNPLVFTHRELVNVY